MTTLTEHCGDYNNHWFTLSQELLIQQTHKHMPTFHSTSTRLLCITYFCGYWHSKWLLKCYCKKDSQEFATIRIILKHRHIAKRQTIQFRLFKKTLLGGYAKGRFPLLDYCLLRNSRSKFRSLSNFNSEQFRQTPHIFTNSVHLTLTVISTV